MGRRKPQRRPGPPLDPKLLAPEESTSSGPPGERREPKDERWTSPSNAFEALNALKATQANPARPKPVPLERVLISRWTEEVVEVEATLQVIPISRVKHPRAPRLTDTDFVLIARHPKRRDVFYELCFRHGEFEAAHKKR